MVAIGLFAGAVGALVGMLGGGGSVLLLPVLVYAAGLAPSQAVALSLLVVAVTSLSALPAHARAGYVDVRTGASVGAGGMIGALVGARISSLLPDAVLLTAFAVLMLGAALQMLRGARCASTEPKRAAVWLALAIGAAVGLVSGLLGAGGGFLIVPALIFVAGMPIRIAIGTSLFVLALQASTGFVAHAIGAQLPIQLAIVVSTAAVAGSVLGARVSRRIAQDSLRRGFAWVMLIAATAVLLEQLPRSLLTAWFHAAREPIAGGALIGLAGALLWLVHGRVAGVSGISGGLFVAGAGDRGWRVSFVIGLLAGGAWLMHAQPTAFEAAPVSLGVAALAGALVGVGTTLANGCTSGHGVCGVSRFSKRSLVATLTFMLAGAATVFVVHRVLGVA